MKTARIITAALFALGGAFVVAAPAEAGAVVSHVKPMTLRGCC